MHEQMIQKKRGDIACEASQSLAAMPSRKSKHSIHHLGERTPIRMKFTATQQQFHRGLALVGHAVPARPTLPIQSSILSIVDGERIRLSATSEDMGIHCWIKAEEIVETGRTLFPAKLISDVVGNLPASPVTITAPSPQDQTACHIACQRISAEIKNAGEDPDEFPEMASYEQGGERLLFLDTALLKQIIGQVAFAAADTDNRPALTGLLISIREGKALFAATDRFRLAMRTIALPDEQLRCEVLAPARTLIVLAKILPPNATVQVILPRGGNQLLFHTDGMDLATRVLNETYLDIRSILQREYTTRVILRTQELAAATRLMLPFAQASEHKIRLSISGEEGIGGQTGKEPNTVTIEAASPDLGRNEQVLFAQVEGPPQRVALNIGYLADVLAVIQEAEVALELISPSLPVAVKPVGPTNYIYVMASIDDPEIVAAQAQNAVQSRPDQASVAA